MRLQTNGPNWSPNSIVFDGLAPGDVGLTQLLTDTLAIMNAEATAAEQAGLGCELRQAEAAYRLAAYVRPW